MKAVIEKSTGIVKVKGELVDYNNDGKLIVNNIIYSDLNKDNTFVVESIEPIKPNYHKYVNGEYIQMKEFETKPIKLNPRTFAVKLLGTPLFNELNKWLIESPLIKDLVEDGVLTEEELTAFKAQLDLDLGEQKISQELYDVILAELNTQQ